MFGRNLNLRQYGRRICFEMLKSSSNVVYCLQTDNSEGKKYNCTAFDSMATFYFSLQFHCGLNARFSNRLEEVDE